MSIVVDDCVESDLFLITNLCNRVDGTHDKLIQVSIHQELWLTAEHGFDNAPDDLLDFLRDLKHLAKLHCGLSTCLKNSSKEEVVWKNLLHVLIL